jgi:hypothetical protein
MINLGFVFGSSIAQEAVHQGIRAERATLSVWAVVLAAGSSKPAPSIEEEPQREIVPQIVS